MAAMPAKSPRRLPTLTIAPSALAITSEFILSPETPEEYHTPLSSSSTSAASFSGLLDADENMAQDLAIFEKLRRNVQLNLQLRPISSGPGDVQQSPTNSPSMYSLDPVSPFMPIYRESLFRRVSSLSRPVLIDTRNGGSYLASRIIGSVNIAIPSLILKRHRKPGANFPSIHHLRTYITTERGKEIWDDTLRLGGPWDGDVVIYDEEMEERERESSTAWVLLSLLGPVLHVQGKTAMYLHGGITAFRQLPDSHLKVVSGERDLDPTPSPVPKLLDTLTTSGSPKRGVFSLDLSGAGAHRSNLPYIEQPSPSPPSNPVTPNASSNSHPMELATLQDLTPSPPPSTLLHRVSQPNIYQPQLNRPRKHSVPNLRRIDTTSAERLPKLTLRTQAPIPMPQRATTLSVPSAGPAPKRLQTPRTPPPLSLRHEPLSSTSSESSATEDEFYTPATAFFYSSSGPPTPRPHSPMTARPQPTTPTSDVPAFTISCILPNFLYLGPELTTQENVRELQSFGVKRILNLAIECDPDDHGLNLRGEFERYVKIAMRDTVEEENIGKGVREVCECLDDARLHSSPTYVHCKAGKSRSVTAVMAYLIHANHWTLSRAYAFVLERRKGISPNIGFVSELMNFEEHELGGKSVGVVKNTDDEDGGMDPGGRAPSYSHMAGMRRPAHMRESLPPIFSANSELAISSGLGLGDEVARVGDHAQELEVKDSTGRYRHQRRAPVDENTLQPLRRVSKAGLESGGWT